MSRRGRDVGGGERRGIGMGMKGMATGRRGRSRRRGKLRTRIFSDLKMRRLAIEQGRMESGMPSGKLNGWLRMRRCLNLQWKKKLLMTPEMMGRTMRLMENKS